MQMTHAPVRRPKSRWAMPVSLQPRAPQSCVVVDARTKQPVRRTHLGYHLRPRRSYQVQLVAQGKENEPVAVSLAAASGVQCANATDVQTSVDDHIEHSLEFEPLREEGWPWFLRGLFSRVETLVVRLEYRDGRDDYEHELPLVVTPSRAWVLWSIILFALPYGISAFMQRAFEAGGDMPAMVEPLRQLVHFPRAWLGATAVVFGICCLLHVLDRLQLGIRFLNGPHAAPPDASLHVRAGRALPATES